MRLTLLTAVGLALVTNLIPGCKPRLQVEEASRGGTTGQSARGAATGQASEGATDERAAPARPAGG